MFKLFNISRALFIFLLDTERNVVYGEIKFATVSDAIEAVMSINYVVFQCKSMYKY